VMQNAAAIHGHQYFAGQPRAAHPRL